MVMPSHRGRVSVSRWDGLPLNAGLLPVFRIALDVEQVQRIGGVVAEDPLQFFLLDIDLGPGEEVDPAGVIQVKMGQHHYGDIRWLQASWARRQRSCCSGAAT